MAISKFLLQATFRAPQPRAVSICISIYPIPESIRMDTKLFHGRGIHSKSASSALTRDAGPSAVRYYTAIHLFFWDQ